MVLHTWGANLSYHPHRHCIVPGGGVTLSKKWKKAKGNGKLIFQVKALSHVFKSKLIKVIKELIITEKLDDTSSLYSSLKNTKWVVYAKPYIRSAKNKDDAQSLIRNLARYTHNIAVSHHRIIRYNHTHVSFTYKVYRHGGQQRVMTLTSEGLYYTSYQKVL